MDASEYQSKARQTAIYPARFEVLYPAMLLASEAGEVASVVQKAMRDNNGSITADSYVKLQAELGDVAWALSNLSSDLGLDLSTVLTQNVEKLRSRAERGVLGGSGDNR